MDDLISRQAVLDKAINIPIAKIVTEDKIIYRRVVFVDEIEKLPSAEKTGHWIYDYTSADGHKTYHCSECGCYLQPKHSEPLNSFKWCSLCGARMVEPQERSEEV